MIIVSGGSLRGGTHINTISLPTADTSSVGANGVILVIITSDKICLVATTQTLSSSYDIMDWLRVAVVVNMTAQYSSEWVIS